MTTLSPDAATTPDYPVRLVVNRPAQQSRLTNFPLGIGLFIKSILLIPHLVILYFLQFVAYIVYFIATIVILFTGRYPEGLFNFFVGYSRWTANVYGYLGSLYDDYPPFSMDSEVGYPLSLEVDYEAQKSHLLNLPVIGLVIKAILLIPHLIIVTFLIFVAYIVVFLAQFAILFTGSFPDGMHGFVVGTERWWNRVNAYIYGLTDRYPPFTMS